MLPKNMSNEIKYRLASLEDVDQLVRLRILMQSERSGSEFPADYPEILKNYFLQSLANGSYLGAVAEYDSELVSTNGLIIFPKPPKFHNVTGYQGYITNVFTLANWRCRGIAGKAMAFLIDEARKRKVEGMILSSSPQGASVYRGLGFKESTQPYFELSL